MSHAARVATAALFSLTLLGTLAPDPGVASPLTSKPTDFGTATAGHGRAATTLSALQATSGVIVNVPVCGALYDQSAPVSVPDGGGGQIVVWADYRGPDLDIYAQKVNASGVPQWTPDGIPVCKQAGAQSAPRVLTDGAGGAFVVWEDARAGATNLDLYAQRISAIGIPLWTSGGVVVCAAANHQRQPAMSSNGLGGVLFTWVDERGADADIYAQRFSSSGVAQWTANGVALCTAAGIQDQPSVVSDASGGAIAVWRDARTDVDLYAQRVSEAGTPLWAANGNVVCAEVGDQKDPAAIVDGAGGVLVAWTDGRGADRDIYAQRVSSAGALQWAASGVTLCAATGHQDHPRLCSDGSHGAVVAWEDRRGADSDIYARLVDENGVPQWTADGEAVCAVAGDQVEPAIAFNPVGGALVAWSDARGGASQNDVYAQCVQPSGAPLWTANGVQLTDASGVQSSPVIVADGNGGGDVAWEDFRAGYSDIYAERVDALGQVPDQCVPPDTLQTSVVQVTVATQNYRTFNQGWFYWSGVAVRGDSGDWDIEQFDQGGFGVAAYPTCFGYQLAGSYGSSGADLVMTNFNDLHTPPGKYGIRAYRYSGTGGAMIEWDDGPDQINVGTSVTRLGWNDLLDVYDVPLTAGNTYTFDLTHSLASDIKLLLFSSYGSPDYYYIAPRSARVAEGRGRYTFYTAPSTEYYGIAIVNDGGVASDYTLQVIAGIPTGVGDSKPGVTALNGIVPNPGRGPVSIQFTLGESGTASFRIFDMAGRQVASLGGRHWQPGSWSVGWDGRDQSGRPLAGGVYFVQMNLNGKRVGFGRLALIH